MDSRVANAWRATWPKQIPEHEYETALMMVELVGTAGRKPEPVIVSKEGGPFAQGRKNEVIDDQRPTSWGPGWT